MTKESSNVAQTIRLVPMDGLIVLAERVLKQLGPKSVDLGEALANQTKELGVRLLLTTALHNHGRKLGLLAGGKLNLHEFVHGFFGIHGTLYRQVDGLAQVDKIRIALVLDFHRLLALRFLI